MRGLKETYSGKHVLVTGGSGFMGKVLVEKLLRSCPEVGKVYILLRPKKGKSVAERLQAMTNVPLFDSLRAERPEALSKLKAVPGDCAELRLGLSAEDEALLAEEVSFVFHAAATVRFDDPLKRALLLNTRGTREMVELAKKMKRLEVLQYCSTTYCYTNQPLVEEKTYSAHLDWKQMLYLAEHEDEHTLNALTHKLLDFQPNTYTFSKALAENIVNDARNDIPIMIFRPAVVISAVQEPLPGWLDNLNGPFGIWGGVLKGVLRYSYGDLDVALSFTPVDWAIRGMLVTAWAKANGMVQCDEREAVEVVNMEGSKYDAPTFRDQYEWIRILQNYMPSPIRYSRYTMVDNYLHYWVGFMICHIPYGMVLDALLMMSGQKPRLIATYRKIFHANDALAHFTLNTFPIATKKIDEIDTLIPENEASEFSCDPRPGKHFKYDRKTFTIDSVEGLAKYVFKEEVDLKKIQKQLTRLKILEVAQYAVLISVLYLTLGKRLRDSLLLVA